jgi:hypothetical protein
MAMDGTLHRMVRRPAPVPAALVRAVLAVLLAFALSGCRPGGVLVTFRPDAGARYSYRIEVTSVSVVHLEGQPPDRQEDRIVLRADHEVLTRGGEGTRVEVRLRGAGDEAPRTFVVTLDRSARLTEVERVEDLPAKALGELGLSEIFPAAAGSPPDRRLRPGERWEIDEELELPSGGSGRLTGHGRVAELGIFEGTAAAVLTTDVTVAVGRSPGARLVGTQTTTSRSIHAVADGSVISSHARTTGAFTIEPAMARLTVEVTSTTRLSPT